MIFQLGYKQATLIVEITSELQRGKAGLQCMSLTAHIHFGRTETQI